GHGVGGAAPRSAERAARGRVHGDPPRDGRRRGRRGGRPHRRAAPAPGGGERPRGADPLPRAQGGRVRGGRGELVPVGPGQPSAVRAEVRSRWDAADRAHAPPPRPAYARAPVRAPASWMMLHPTPATVPVLLVSTHSARTSPRSGPCAGRGDF